MIRWNSQRLFILRTCRNVQKILHPIKGLPYHIPRKSLVLGNTETVPSEIFQRLTFDSNFGSDKTWRNSRGCSCGILPDKPHSWQPHNRWKTADKGWSSNFDVRLYLTTIQNKITAPYQSPQKASSLGKFL